MKHLKKDRFFFLHIPKTAGMSLHRLLEQTAGPYVHLRYPHQLRWSSASIWDRFRGFGGHHTCAFFKHDCFLRGFAFTFLRDPIQRVISQFDFSCLEGHNDLPDAIFARSRSLSTALRQARGQFGSFWNAQTFHLSSLPSDITDPQRHLDSALGNLEKFDFIGTTDTIAVDAPQLVRLLGGSLEINVPHENRTNRKLNRTALDEETSVLLAETQALDQVLYTRAKQLRARQKPSLPLRKRAMLNRWPPIPNSTGSGEATISRVAVSSTQGSKFYPGAELELSVQLTAKKQLRGVTIGFSIEDHIGNYVAGTNSDCVTGRSLEIPAGSFCAAFRFPVYMGAGQYSVTVAIHRGGEKIHWLTGATNFEVEQPFCPYREGLVDINATFHAGSESSMRLSFEHTQSVRLI